MRLAGLCLAFAGVLAACSDDNETVPGDPQTPPTSGRADVEKWISAGYYKTWASEPAVHASRAPSPHGFNRIYSNDLLAGTPAATASWPKGVAAVKEIYASATATAPGGYAVYLKTQDNSADGANWYWYERLPGDDAPVADGMGGSGSANTICVGCHKAAGSDADHTPTAGGRDQVYTPVH